MTRQRWTSSSKRNPCPLCGRDTDDKCRRSADLISCYWGERFSPPAGLKLSQVLTVEGHSWAVVNLSGGFAGNSLILRPHIDRHAFKPAQQQQQRREVAALAPVLKDLFARVRLYVQATYGIRELEWSTADQIHQDQQLLATTTRHLQDLRAPLFLARRDDPTMGHLVAAVDLWLRQVSYQACDLEAFNSWALGTPSPEAIAALQLEVR